MKNTYRGFSGIMLIILVALVAIGVGGYFYMHKVTSIEEVSLENVTDQTATTSPSVTSSTTVVTTTVKGKSCGTVVDTHVFVESEKRTAAEISALTCISNAAIQCTPAYLDVTGNDAGSYQVLSRNGENCSIATTFGEYKRCEVPVTLIADLEKYAIKEKEPIEDLITVVNLLMAFGEGKNIETGESIKLSCQNK
jgi:hypothetical protein